MLISKIFLASHWLAITSKTAFYYYYFFFISRLKYCFTYPRGRLYKKIKSTWSFECDIIIFFFFLTNVCRNLHFIFMYCPPFMFSKSTTLCSRASFRFPRTFDKYLIGTIVFPHCSVAFIVIPIIFPFQVSTLNPEQYILLLLSGFFWVQETVRKYSSKPRPGFCTTTDCPQYL